MKPYQTFASIFRGLRVVASIAFLVLIGIMIGRSTVPGRDAANEVRDQNLPADQLVWRVYDVDDVYVKCTEESISELEQLRPSNIVQNINICFPSNAPYASLDSFQFRLLGVIESTIEPYSWRVNGGTEGVTAPFGRRLAIWHKPQVHAKVRNFLAELRRDPKQNSNPSILPAADRVAPSHLGDQSVLRVYIVDQIVEQAADQLIADWKSGPPADGSKKSSWTPAEGRYAALQHVQEQLISCIEQTIESESWKDNGGTVGEIRALGHRLVVDQTLQAHMKIEVLLANLRRDSQKRLEFPATEESK